MIRRFMTRLFPALLVALALCISAGPASAITLRADTTTITLPNCDVPQNCTVTAWGFADDTAGAGTGQVMVPGPTLKVGPGTTLSITLNNRLPVPVSLIIPGLPPAAGGQYSYPLPAAGAPGSAGDGVTFDAAVPAAKIPLNPNFTVDLGMILPKNRALSLTSIVAPPGGSATYNIPITGRTGTYIYESGTHQQVQLPMGLYGALVIDPKYATGTLPPPPYTAYAPTATNPGTIYFQDQVVVFSEILARYDWTLNPPRFVTFNEDVLAALAQSPGKNLTMTNMVEYKPLFSLINGKSYPDTIAPTPISATPGAPTVPGMFAPPGQVTLLRLINAGRENRVPTIQGAYLDNLDPAVAKPHAIYSQVIAEDGRLSPYANQEFAPILPAGKSLDVMVDLTRAQAPGYYALYDRRLSLNNAGVFPGGMLSFLASWDPTSTDTRLNNCSPFKGDLNSDGKINIVDAVMALQAVVAGSYSAAGDITPLNNGLPCGGDGLGGAKTALTLSDALFILQKAIGLNPY
jgi:FtsP/CotA-like multicopper oxidase with cupredoxin domain